MLFISLVALNITVGLVNAFLVQRYRETTDIFESMDIVNEYIDNIDSEEYKDKIRNLINKLMDNTMMCRVLLILSYLSYFTPIINVIFLIGLIMTFNEKGE